jgi:hypothetical protein
LERSDTLLELCTRKGAEIATFSELCDDNFVKLVLEFADGVRVRRGLSDCNNREAKLETKAQAFNDVQIDLV